MSKPLIALIQHDRNPSGYNLTQLRPVLELLSYRVAVCLYSTTRQIVLALKGIAPDLILLDRPLMPGALLAEGCGSLGNAPLICPQIVLDEKKEALAGKTDFSAFPLDIVALHGLIRKQLVRYPRNHLRMSVHLPCLFSVRGLCNFGEILSLGTGGAFIKTMGQHLRTGDLLDVGIPLLGMKKELEVRSRVVYLLAPGPENNYLQGMGVEFLSLDQETSGLLQDFVQHSLAQDTEALSPCRGLAGPPSLAAHASASRCAAASSPLHLLPVRN